MPVRVVFSILSGHRRYEPVAFFFAKYFVIPKYCLPLVQLKIENHV